nr:uncharacterized protein LOC117458233 isoform X2 [Pseudochaenichthys georgianus]
MKIYCMAHMPDLYLDVHAECLCDAQNEDIHLPGGRPARPPLRLHQRSDEAGVHSQTALHLHVGEMSRELGVHNL